MSKKNNLIYTTVTLLLLFVITSCSDDDSTGGIDDQRVTINGTVEDEFSKSKSDAAAKDLENTLVYAATINSDGSVEIIEETETEVNASGEFTLEVDADAAEEIVVIADYEGDQLKGYLTAEVENGGSYTIKPINEEYSAETDIYAEVKSNGNADIVHKSDIEILVTANNVSDIHEDSSATFDIAAAVTNSAEARVEFFEEFSGDSVTNLDGYFETMTEAQVDLESELYTSSSTDEREAAFEGYLETEVNAYNETGLEEKETAELLHLQGTVILNSFNSVSSEVQNDVRASASYLHAIATDNAVQARAEASELSETTVSAIADAGVTLRSEVQGSAGSEATIEAAFETYHDEVRSAIGNDSSVEGTAVETIDAEIHIASGAKATFDSAISGVVDSPTLIDAYVEFDSSVRTIVDINSTLIGDIEAETLSDILVLINLSS